MVRELPGIGRPIELARSVLMPADRGVSIGRPTGLAVGRETVMQRRGSLPPDDAILHGASIRGDYAALLVRLTRPGLRPSQTHPECAEPSQSWGVASGWAVGAVVAVAAVLDAAPGTSNLGTELSE